MTFLIKTIWIRSFVALWIVECKLFLRQPTAAFFTFVLPISFFLLFGSIFGEAPLWDRPDVRYIDFYAPALMAAYIGQTGLVNLTNSLSEYRLLGILKRYVVSPALARILPLCPHYNANSHIYYFCFEFIRSRRGCFRPSFSRTFGSCPFCRDDLYCLLFCFGFLGQQYFQISKERPSSVPIFVSHHVFYVRSYFSPTNVSRLATGFKLGFPFDPCRYNLLWCMAWRSDISICKIITFSYRHNRAVVLNLYSNIQMGGVKIHYGLSKVEFRLHKFLSRIFA